MLRLPAAALALLAPPALAQETTTFYAVRDPGTALAEILSPRLPELACAFIPSRETLNILDVLLEQAAATDTPPDESDVALLIVADNHLRGVFDGGGRGRIYGQLVAWQPVDAAFFSGLLTGLLAATDCAPVAWADIGTLVRD